MKLNKSEERLSHILSKNKELPLREFNEKYLLINVDIGDKDLNLSENDKMFFTEVNPENPGFILIDREIYEIALSRFHKYDNS